MRKVLSCKAMGFEELTPRYLALMLILITIKLTYAVLVLFY